MLENVSCTNEQREGLTADKAGKTGVGGVNVGVTLVFLVNEAAYGCV